MARPQAYRPTRKVQEARTEVYSAVESMLAERDRTWAQFNGPDGNRTLIQYIDDNERRLNGFRPTREEQDKEEWQANVFDNVTRVKLKAFCAGVALNIPEQDFRATNEEGLFSAQRAEAMKQLVRHSYIVDDNPQLQTFFEVWNMLAVGTVIKFDGFLKYQHKSKIITGFDEDTGEVMFEEKEVTSENRCIDVDVPLSEFLIWDFNVFNVQEQPRVAWIQHYNKDTLKLEFGHLPNFKYVKDAASVSRFASSTTTHFYDKWASRVEKENDYELVRYYSVPEDRYEIWCNGVDLLRSPMLWGRKKKRYPFSKSIREPFVGKPFFYGIALPHELEGHQDVKNTVWNTTLDKLYRSLVPPMLVGMANKDMLDLEDEYVNQDNKIYVPDVNQVKPMPYPGVGSGEITMMNMIQRALDLQSTDQLQSGISGKGVTAREIVLADENARKLKGITFMFLEDLHMQKTRNRILNILMNYMPAQIEEVVGEDAARDLKGTMKIFNINNVTHSDGTKGTLGVQVVKDKKNLPTVIDVEAREEAMQKQGINYKMIAITTDYFDDWEFDFVVVPESLFAQDKVKKEALINEKIEKTATYFPERFISNKDKFFDEMIEVYGDSPEEYAPAAPPPPPQQDVAALLAGGGAPAEGAVPVNQ